MENKTNKTNKTSKTSKTSKATKIGNTSKQGVKTGIKKSNGQKKPSVPKIKIVFVCTGNTCRSPMLECCFKAFLKHKKMLSKFDIKSAGIMAIEGDITSENAVLACKALGIACTAKKARQLDEHLTKKSDYIICVSQRHKEFIETEFVKVGAKVLAMSQIIEGGQDIPDPYGLGLEEYSAVLEYFKYLCEGMLGLVSGD